MAQETVMVWESGPRSALAEYGEYLKFVGIASPKKVLVLYSPQPSSSQPIPPA